MTNNPHDPELRSVVVDALVGMVSGVTGMIPPADAPLPGFIQGPVDRAMSKIDAARAADKARIAELEEALEEIISPIKFMQERLEEGEQLNGMAAIQLAEDSSYLRSIAITALTTYRKGGEV